MSSTYLSADCSFSSGAGEDLAVTSVCTGSMAGSDLSSFKKTNKNKTIVFLLLSSPPFRSAPPACREITDARPFIADGH